MKKGADKKETKKVEPAKPPTTTKEKTAPTAGSSKAPPDDSHKSNWKLQDAETIGLIRDDKKSYHQLTDQEKKIVSQKDLNPAGGGGGGTGILTVGMELILVIETPMVVGVVRRGPIDIESLPSEEPIDYSKYTTCPHCGRRFTKEAAARHIPQCESYDYNKADKENFAKNNKKDNKKP